MQRIPDSVVNFFKDQNFVIVSTIDGRGRPHSSCKGLIGIEKNGRVYLLDLYFKETFANLKDNPNLSLTAIDEHRFKGYCLKGKAKIYSQEKLSEEMKQAWEERITSRLTQRLLKNIKGEKGHPKHPESLLPKPAYMILAQVEEVVDLTPHHLKEGE